MLVFLFCEHGYCIIREVIKIKKQFKLAIFTVLMLVVTWLLSLVTKNPLFDFNIFASDTINNFLNYQLSGLIIACMTLVLIYVFADKTRLQYLNFNRRGEMKPSKLLRLKEAGRWETDAWWIAVPMILILGGVLALQTFSSDFTFTWIYLVIAIPLAASNAFIEEVIFRLSYVSVGKDLTKSATYGLLMSSIIFGFIHYWGIAPNGIFGALISAYLGFFLAKSILETKGFYWAFVVHFLLDVVILMVIFNIAA